MTEYEEICNGKSIDELKVEYRHQVKELGYNEGDSFPSYILSLVESKRAKREPESYDIKFKGVDFWGRPVYKIQGLNVYIGDIENLWYGKTKEQIDEYYKDNLNQLVIFGSTFDEDDPLGTNVKANITLNII